MRGVFEKVKGSGDWYISYFDADSKHHREHVGRYSAAVEAYVNRKREIREAKFVAPVDRKKMATTFEELFELRLAALQRNFSKWTVARLRYQIGSERMSHFKTLPVQKIRAAEIERVLNDIDEQGLGSSSVASYRALISAVFNFGVKRDFLQKNPTLETLKPKPAKERVRFLSYDEEEALRRAIRARWPDKEPEFDVLLHSGMRSGELYLLTWDRVDLDRGVIDVPPAGKTGWRNIPINSACRGALEKLYRESRGSAFVIPRIMRNGKESNRWWAIDYWFDQARLAAGVLNVSPHTLRHTFASRLVMAGVNLRQVQEFLGHATIHMTMKYAHLAPERGQVDIEKLVSAAKPKPPVRVRASKPAVKPAAKLKVVKIA